MYRMIVIQPGSTTDQREDLPILCLRPISQQELLRKLKSVNEELEQILEIDINSIAKIGNYLEKVERLTIIGLATGAAVGVVAGALCIAGGVVAAVYSVTTAIPIFISIGATAAISYVVGICSMKVYKHIRNKKTKKARKILGLFRDLLKKEDMKGDLIKGSKNSESHQEAAKNGAPLLKEQEQKHEQGQDAKAGKFSAAQFFGGLMALNGVKIIYENSKNLYGSIKGLRKKRVGIAATAISRAITALNDKKEKLMAFKKESQRSNSTFYKECVYLRS